MHCAAAGEMSSSTAGWFSDTPSPREKVRGGPHAGAAGRGAGRRELFPGVTGCRRTIRRSKTTSSLLQRSALVTSRSVAAGPSTSQVHPSGSRPTDTVEKTGCYTAVLSSKGATQFREHVSEMKIRTLWLTLPSVKQAQERFCAPGGENLSFLRPPPRA